MSMELTPNWPLSSIVYQIYPRSFYDANGDGIGDLQGIIQKADYLVSLGVTAIWLSPMYPSPQADFGYDISDFCNIDPMYGTLEEFDELVETYHSKGIRIMLDYVPNHTSDEHPWFMESKSSRDNPKRDWYIWAEPKPDGSAPNNWLSNFGGSAWEYDEQTKQYYYHAFDKKQPDLNWRNPQVVNQMLEVLRFWMNRGVDGFRVDAVYFLFEDPTLTDEEANPNYVLGQSTLHDALLHTKTFALPETLAMMKKMTDVLKEYQDKFMVTEVYAGLEELLKMYRTIDWQFYSPFNFSFISLPWLAEPHKQYIDGYDKALGDVYIPSYVLGNHDSHRVATRIGEKQARVAAMAQLTLRGLPYIYMGEELGMTDTPIPPEKVVDTYEINSPGLGLGRDPERTPMQWNDTKNAGFSTADKTWLPVNDNYKKINVASEDQDPHSMLTLYKLLIKLKKHHPSLREGSYFPVSQPAENVFAYLRKKDDEQMLILLNFYEKDKHISFDLATIFSLNESGSAEDAKDLNKSIEATLICETSLTKPEGEKIDLTNFTLPGNEGYLLELA